MDLELHQLDLRYEALRTRNPGRERRLLASLAELGQQTPIVVVTGDGGRSVLVDGYKRVRALRRLGHDVVRATLWDLAEADALVMEQLLRAREADSPLEQGWLLGELVARFGLTTDELARRFDRSASWVSGRLGLVRDLPELIQDLVRRGAIGAHAAMRYLVPFARANGPDCLKLAQAIATMRLSSRQLGELYAAYHSGEEKARHLVLTDPALVLRAREEARSVADKDRKPTALIISDLEIIGSVARRTNRRLSAVVQALCKRERDEIHKCSSATRSDLALLWQRLNKEVIGAQATYADNDS